jgi:hypothetical protein
MTMKANIPVRIPRDLSKTLFVPQKVFGSYLRIVQPYITCIQQIGVFKFQ